MSKDGTRYKAGVVSSVAFSETTKHEETHRIPVAEFSELEQVII